MSTSVRPSTRPSVRPVYHARRARRAMRARRLRARRGVNARRKGCARARESREPVGRVGVPVGGYDKSQEIPPRRHLQETTQWYNTVRACAQWCSGAVVK